MDLFFRHTYTQARVDESVLIYAEGSLSFSYPECIATFVYYLELNTKQNKSKMGNMFAFLLMLSKVCLLMKEK